jgi:hypothetical protein
MGISFIALAGAAAYLAILPLVFRPEDRIDVMRVLRHFAGGLSSVRERIGLVNQRNFT